MPMLPFSLPGPKNLSPRRTDTNSLPAVATYDLQPEMSAAGVAAAIVAAMRSDKYHLIVANFANAVVGHTGILPAAVKRLQRWTVGGIDCHALSRGWRAVICGDHGNAEQMLDERGLPHTVHTVNPVPAIVLNRIR